MTLARCASAVIGSPRRSSALPPRATTMRMASVPERRDENRLDGMHSVLRLLEGDVHLGFEHLLGHFHAPSRPNCSCDVPADLGLQIVERRQAMHEFDTRVAGAFIRSMFT